MATLEQLNRVDRMLEEYYPHKPGWYLAYGWLYNQVLDGAEDRWIHDPDTPEGKARFDELFENPMICDNLTFLKREDGSYWFSQHVVMPETAGGEYNFWFALSWESGGEPCFRIDIGAGAYHQWAGLESWSGEPDTDALFDIIMPGWRGVLDQFKYSCEVFLHENDLGSLPVGEEVLVE